MLICTISTNNHLPRAMVLAKSVKENMPQTSVVVCLLEREIHSSLRELLYIDEIILAKDLGLDDFDNFIFKYQVNQASFALKAKLIEYLVNVYQKENKFVYLDSDIRVYSPLVELEMALDSYSIVLTPHILEAMEKEFEPITDQNSHLTIDWRELGVIKTGLYNAGFFAISRTNDSKKFLKWWMYRNENHCYSDYARGINYDQKWLDLVPCLFDCHILRHPGYNMAYWNLSERNLQISGHGEYTVNGSALRFFHFSSVGGTLDFMIERCFPYPKDAQVVRSLLESYIQELEKMEPQKFSNIPWSYGYFFSGEQIRTKSRRRYRKNQWLIDRFYNQPFELSNNHFSNKNIGKLKKNDSQ